MKTKEEIDKEFEEERKEIADRKHLLLQELNLNLEDEYFRDGVVFVIKFLKRKGIVPFKNCLRTDDDFRRIDDLQDYEDCLNYLSWRTGLIKITKK